MVCQVYYCLSLCGRGHDRPQLMRIFVRQHQPSSVVKRNVIRASPEGGCMKPALVGALAILVVAAAPRDVLAQRHASARILPTAAELTASPALRPASVAQSAVDQSRLVA